MEIQKRADGMWNPSRDALERLQCFRGSMVQAWSFTGNQKPNELTYRRVRPCLAFSLPVQSLPQTARWRTWWLGGKKAANRLRELTRSTARDLTRF